MLGGPVEKLVGRDDGADGYVAEYSGKHRRCLACRPAFQIGQKATVYGRKGGLLEIRRNSAGISGTELRPGKGFDAG